MNEYTVSIKQRRAFLFAALLFLVAIGWTMRHIQSTVATIHGEGARFGIIFTVAFVLLVLQITLAYMDTPRTVTRKQAKELAHHWVAVNVPVYHEDPKALAAGLDSILDQKRPVQFVHVVVNGNDDTDYEIVKDYFLLKAERVGVMAEWSEISRKGKRQAQGETVRRIRYLAKELAIHRNLIKVMTVDSDGILDPHAVDELMKPFADKKVYSVAGIVIAVNNRVNPLARFTDLLYVTAQLVDRSSQSVLNSVMVNSGVIAMYRFEVLNNCLDSYLSETFFGRAVEFSDDSRLTLEALQYGKTVQQTSAIAFTLMPENLSHHLRQYTRWMRGSFIRSWWRFKYLPMNKPVYWLHFLRWTLVVLGTFVFGDIFAVEPALTHALSPWLLVVTVLIGYLQSLRYLIYKRSDESNWSRVLTYSMSPLASLWSYFVLRLVRWYAIATCLKTGWGTRKEVEVALNRELVTS